MARRKRQDPQTPSWAYNETAEEAEYDRRDVRWYERDIDAPWWKADDGETDAWQRLMKRPDKAPGKAGVPGKDTRLFLHRDCHGQGNTLVYSTPTMRVYGSGSERGAMPIAGGIHLNLGPQYSWYTPAIAQSPGIIFPALAQWTEIPQEIRVVWPDMHVPQLSALFWQTLADSLVGRAETSAMLDVVVFCMGGHGRTGTALAILLGLWGIQEPWTYLWEHYCKEAIETAEQETYIHHMLGLT